MTKIAIIEDDALIAEMYRLKLESENFEVDVAPDGNSGISVVREKIPDIILLDLTLPDITGDEVLRQIREIPTALATPVMVLTNLDDESAPKRLAKWDIDDYLIKANFTPREVVARIDAVLDRRANFNKSTEEK